MAIDVEIWHPKLIGKDYKIIPIPKNTEIDDFNCHAYVVDIYNDWCGASEKSWPYLKISRYPTLENYIKYFGMFGYNMCETDEYEENFNKIAIFINKKYVTHSAKQFGNKWRSKLGEYYIIEHELEWLTGYDAKNYGEIGAILKRKI